MHTCDPQTQEAEPDFPVIHTGIVLNYWELAKFIDGILNMKVGFSATRLWEQKVSLLKKIILLTQTGSHYLALVGVLGFLLL